MYKINNKRSGITLLLVLVLMLLFAMLVTAFMVIVSLHRRTIESYARALLYPSSIQSSMSVAKHGNPGDIDEAVQRLLVGGLDHIIGPHSILENLYGHPGNGSPQTRFNAAPYPPIATSQGLLQIRGIPPERIKVLGNVVTVEFSDTYMEENPDAASLHHKSTFVVDVLPDDPLGIAGSRVLLAPFAGTNLSLAQQSSVLSKSGESWLLFNTPQFSGTGAGYQYPPTPPIDFNALALLARTDNNTAKPLALIPNILAPIGGTQYYKQYLQSNDVRMNPDYTAPDFMTMFLAWNDVKNKKIIPSFHRPQLVRYWVTNDMSNYRLAPQELRKYVLRPLPTDHPNFTGSNPAAVWDYKTQDIPVLKKFLTEGPWDVDNDGNGNADGIWLDIGLPARFDAETQSYYKPLVSYYVVDLDGRINLNTIGNLEKTLPPNDAEGMGMGPAELSSQILEPTRAKILTGDGNFEGRYGSSGTPGGSGDMRINNGINLGAYTGGGLPADWHGTSPMGFDVLGNRVVTPSPAVNPYLMDPYSDANGDKPFSPDDLESLVRSVIDLDYNSLPPRLRTLLGDAFDTGEPAFASPTQRYSLGTRSSDIPAAGRNVPVYDGTRGYTGLYDHVLSLCGSDTTKADELWLLLPEEIRRGEKVNLNRLTLREDWMTGGNDLLKAKARFAQEIFYLLRVLLPYDTIHQDEETLERLAQWSVNLVDFIDPDDVMTPFIYQGPGTGTGLISTFDNAALIDLLLAGNLYAGDMIDAGYKLVWGFEKPEVAITETFAVHDRQVADTPTGAGRIEDGDQTFDQVARPQGSLFVELYRQGNPQRTSYPANCVVDPDGTLRLDKTTSTNDYIWRLAVGEAAKIDAPVSPSGTPNGDFRWTLDGTDRARFNALRQLLIPSEGKAVFPQFYQWSGAATGPEGRYHPDLGSPEQFIWFGQAFPSAPQLADTDTLSDTEIKQRSFVNALATDVSLVFDSHIVIAPREITSFNSVPTDETTIDLTNVNAMIAVNPNVMSRGVSAPTEVNVSEVLPTNSFEDGYSALMGLSLPLYPRDAPFPVGTSSEITRQIRGTIPCYKTICLQRLADPNRPHHPIGNPYITVDWSMIDLQVINTATDPAGADELQEPNLVSDASMHFASRQWKQETSGFRNLWDRTVPSLTNPAGALNTNDPKAVGLEKSEYTTYSDSANLEPLHTLGVSNFSDLPQLHFPWHDAPLMNTAELMLVPATAPGRFGIEFHHNDTGKFFGLHDLLTQVCLRASVGSTIPVNERPRFGYFYEGSAYGNIFAYLFSPYLNWGEYKIPDESYMQRLFDFVRVPSRFSGTIQDWTRILDPPNPPRPGSPMYRMREPGKINLNTLTEEGWESLRNGRVDFPSYDDFRQYRQWSAVDPDGYPSEFRPFRSPSAMNLVPPLRTSTQVNPPNRDDMVRPPISATLLDLDLIEDNAENPYAALENVMRLSDVTTTRSNVFAVWVTVGYFNVEKFEGPTAFTDFKEKYHPTLSHINDESVFRAVYPDGCVLGAEKGRDNATVKRHRAFYLIDRSIPVGFRRGEKLNSTDVIIKKTMLD